MKVSHDHDSPLEKIVEEVRSLKILEKIVDEIRSLKILEEIVEEIRSLKILEKKFVKPYCSKKD